MGEKAPKVEGFVSVGDYLKLPNPGGKWVVEDLLPVGGYLNIYGDPKAGKSMVAAQLASAISTDDVHEMLGFPIRKHGYVAYFQMDTPRAMWQLRFHRLTKKGYKFDRVYISDKWMLGDKGWPFNIQVNGKAWLHAHLAKMPGKPIVVVVDTLRDIHDGDENSSNSMKAVIEAIELATRPAAVILVSHARKRGKDDPDNVSGDSRGSSYVPGKMDANMLVDKERFIFSSRTAAEARYQLKKAPADGELKLNDEMVAMARAAILKHGPATDPVDLVDEFDSQLKKRSIHRNADVIYGTLQRMRSIEYELKLGMKLGIQHTDHEDTDE